MRVERSGHQGYLYTEPRARLRQGGEGRSRLEIERDGLGTRVIGRNERYSYWHNVGVCRPFEITHFPTLDSRPGSPPSPLISTIFSLLVSLATRSGVRPFGLSRRRKAETRMEYARAKLTQLWWPRRANRPTAIDQLIFNLPRCFCRRSALFQVLPPPPPKPAPTGPRGPVRPAPTRRALTPRRVRSLAIVAQQQRRSSSAVQ